MRVFILIKNEANDKQSGFFGFPNQNTLVNLVVKFMSDPVRHIAHCSSCGCKMDISAMDPYTNVVCPDCGHHTRVKCELGHYLLTSRHAVGGMSMVFGARDTTLERDVAIKILNEEYSRDAKRMEEFEREAKITAALSHAHIVRVFTVGKSFGHYYIAMEMVPGDNLEQKISKEGAIGEEEMLPIALEIISGLRAAKSAGLIHRDMKPGNILFDDAGHAKIVDFGLALVTMGGKVKAEEIWATPYYVPPEALDGEEEDFRSDMYALGATLYHAFSGKPPLPSEAKSTREVRKAKENIEPLAKVAPWLHSATCYLVDKSMALRPEDRFESYSEMEEAWNAAFHAMRGGGADEPIHSEGRLRRRVSSKKALFGLMAAGVVVLSLITAAAFYFINKEGGGSELVEDSTNDLTVLSDAGVEQSNTQNSEGEYDPEVAARIGGLFRKSHTLLQKQQYSEAQKMFVKLANEPGVREPLSSWARVEALISVWLGGDSVALDEALRKFRKHQQSSQANQDDAMQRLGGFIGSLEIIKKQDVQQDGSKEPMAIVRLVALALKNWEIGAWQQAVPIFQKARNHPLPTGSPLLVYRDISNRYLKDYQSLKPLSELNPVNNIPEAKDRLQGLNKLLRHLQTQGRARFHVRVWQMRLHHQIKEMELKAQVKAHAIKPEEKKPDFKKVEPQFRRLIRDAKFSEASKILQSLPLENPQKELCDAWLYLADSSNGFLSLLEQSIPQNGLLLEVRARAFEHEGKGYPKVVSAKLGGLLLLADNGEEFLSWGSVAPDSVIAVFQAALKPNLTTPEGQLNTEQAICYAWLSGLEEKASLAAAKLSDVNEGFRERWAQTMRTLDMNQ